MEQLFSPKLAALEWLEHGFGTRNSAAPHELARLKQIHSAIVLTATENACVGAGDALLTNRAGVAVSIRTADCIPILLADPRTRSVAAVHAGWRGTAARIAARAVETLRAQFGSDARDLVVAIGPGIGPCCYEVGPEVAREFGFDGRVHLDLAGENRRRLIEAGVPDSQIDVLALCTKCRPDLFYSWRRDGPTAGRMVSWISVKRNGTSYV